MSNIVNYILTERPADMSYEAYKIIKNQQKKALNKYKQGKLPVQNISKKS